MQLREDNDRLMNLNFYSSDEDDNVSNSAPIEDWNYYNDTVDQVVDNIKADQKYLLHDISRSISSHFLLNNHFRIMRRKIAMHKNTRTSFLMQ